MIHRYCKYLRTPFGHGEHPARCPAREDVIEAFLKVQQEASPKMEAIRSHCEQKLPRIFCAGDLHLSHTNIIQYCDRPFVSVESMNDQLVANFRKTLTADDLLILVGDLSMRGPQGANWFLDQMPGEVIVVAGNHDIHRSSKSVGSFHALLTCAVLELSLPDGRELVFSHYPIQEKLLPLNAINIHGHIHHHALYPSLGSGAQHRNVSVEQIDYAPAPLLPLCAAKS